VEQPPWFKWGLSVPTAPLRSRLRSPGSAAARASADERAPGLPGAGCGRDPWGGVDVCAGLLPHV